MTAGSRAPATEARPSSARGAAMSRHDLVGSLTNVPLVLGLAGLIAIAAAALFGPQLAPSDPQAQRVIIFYPDHSFAAPPTPPDQYYPLGTDPLGRDQLSRLLWGARLTLTVVVLGLAGRALLGVGIGVASAMLAKGGRVGRWTDRLIEYGTNAASGLPQLMLALLLVIALQGQGLVGFVLALALVGWAELAQFVRAEVLRALATAHVEAARALGAKAARIARTHVLRDLAPQLSGVLALEAGSVLLLLAELGFIGFFVSGGTFYVDDSGRPILPVRDRAPEWGQMLAGARQYAFDHQYVAFVPGVVVVGAVLAFNLFAEGLRSASDPFSRFRLSPRALGGIGRALAAGALVSLTVFGYLTLRSTTISFEDGLVQARAAAERLQPGSELIAGVVRFRSSEHALARPEKINYYFRRPSESAILRVGFVDADPNAMEVKRFDHEDDLFFDALRPLGEWKAGWEKALGAAEELDGRNFRNRNPEYVVHVILRQEHGAPAPEYRVRYGSRIGPPLLDIRVSALSGAIEITRETRFADAFGRAREALRGDVVLVAVFGRWQAAAPGRPDAHGVGRPGMLTYSFARADLPADTRTARVTYAGPSTLPQVLVGSGSGRPPTISFVDLEAVFARVEDSGGRALRDRWSSEGARDWTVSAFTLWEPAPVVNFNYSATAAGQVTFSYDIRTGRIELIPAPTPQRVPVQGVPTPSPRAP